MCVPGWPGTHCGVEEGTELLILLPSLGLQACSSTPGEDVRMLVGMDPRASRMLNEHPIGILSYTLNPALLKILNLFETSKTQKDKTMLSTLSQRKIKRL